MILDYNFLTKFIDDQKSIFEKERNSLSNLISIIISEFRSSIVQTGSVCAFIITILFGILTFNWIDDSIIQLLAVTTILISIIFIFGMEYFRKQFLTRQVELTNTYDSSLWTFLELKRNLMTNLVLDVKLDYRILYFFIFCVVCSERIKIISSCENLLQIKIFKLKKNDFQQFYSESEDIIKQGKTTLETFSTQFKSEEYLKPLLFLLDPLKDYQIKS